MTNRSLEIFVAVAECENMSLAARKLFITQSSVSQVVSEIEREHGVLLFDRLSKSLHLTEVGRAMLLYAKRTLALQAEMEEYLRCASRQSKVRIGATVTVGTCVISPILLQLKANNPGLIAEVLVANTHILEEKLLQSELDICLVEGRIENSDLIVQKAIGDRLVLICSPLHPFYGRSSVSLDEVSAHPIILRERGSGTRAQIEQQFLGRKLPMNIIWDCYNTEAIINGVIDNHGISIISERLVRDAVNQGRLWMCSVSDVDFSRSFDLVYHKDKYITPALQNFINATNAYRSLGDNTL